MAYVHGVTPGGLFTCMTLGQSPEKRIGQCVFSKVCQYVTVDFELRKLCYADVSILAQGSYFAGGDDLREFAMASSENASMGVAS